jgi:trimethylamine--corrinoid protein Co-methyltransferase
MEATASVILSILTGNNLVHDVGYLESGLTSSFEMIALNDTAIQMARHLLKPIVVDEENLALDLIHQVGPGGTFLEEAHTLRHFREVWYNDLLDRKNYEGWLEEGCLTMGDRLNQRVKDILHSHRPEPLPEDCQQVLREMVRGAERRLVVEGSHA